MNFSKHRVKLTSGVHYNRITGLQYTSYFSEMIYLKICFLILLHTLFLPTTSTQQTEHNTAKLSDVCKVRHGLVKVRVSNCIPRNLILPQCSGNCFSMDNWKTTRPCSCCKPIKSRCTIVDLKCYDTDSLVVKRYRIPYALDCSCSSCLDSYKNLATTGSTVDIS